MHRVKEAPEDYSMRKQREHDPYLKSCFEVTGGHVWEDRKDNGLQTAGDCWIAEGMSCMCSALIGDEKQTRYLPEL